jgi:exopolysaccharide biosynthesis WecB/TagA/CpsF family protein
MTPAQPLKPFPERPRQAVDFLGLPFEAFTAAKLADLLNRLARADRRFVYVVTPNVDHMVRLDADPSLRPLYDGAEFIVNDSRILEWLARREGLELTASPGADVVQIILETHIDRGEPLTVIGGTGDVIAAVCARFGLVDVRWFDAPMGLRNKPEAIAACAEFVARNPSRFVFLCVGSPQQEMVAAAIAARTDTAGIGLCCGASLDFLGGKAARAPLWMRRARLEWLHRLISEPGRLAKRYLVQGPKILAIAARHRRDEP